MPTMFIEFDPETKMYVGTIPGIPGAHTQGASLEELQENMKEVLELCLEIISDNLLNREAEPEDAMFAASAQLQILLAEALQTPPSSNWVEELNNV
jgi:predicted RNase H-like HicB family nuclease